MVKYRVFLSGLAFVLAISAAAATNVRTAPSPAKSNAQTLYRPSDCQQFSCQAAGTVSCNNYDQTISGTVCSSPLINSLFHN